jgi:MORN repeat variant
MRRWIPAVLLPMSLTLASASHALAPGDRERGFREGANHHIGDDSFAAFYGRLPGASDTEQLRMHAHFTHVRGWLASRPATKPELEGRRAEILGYFDEYIAKGTTPQNAHLPWRTPVFIDDHGTICAVGYLIERSAGRPLAEKIARDHRYNVLEDIAAAMPAVRAWVESSGLTLDELASVQPGYIPVATWNEMDLTSTPAGKSALELASDTKSGTWRSKYPNGQRLAEGPFVDKKATGTWRFFHPSGNLSAEGSFFEGYRDGSWTFFHDSKERVPMAKGAFQTGSLIEEWRHFDATGKLIARARPASPETFGGAGYLLDVIPRADQVQHWVHQGHVAGLRHRLDFLADGTEHLYVHDSTDIAFDQLGHKLAKVDGLWQSSDCHWNRVRKASARNGDVVTLHGLTFQGQESCDAPQAVPAARAKHLDAMLAVLHPEKPQDLAEDLAGTMASYLARPEVDGSVPRPDRPTVATR